MGPPSSMTILVLLFGALALILIYMITPPLHPRQIPAIPIWITLRPLFFDVDQEQVFREYIAGPLYLHGAVKVFFGGQWNVIVERPRYLAEVLRNEQVYQKSGNQKKIPHSLLAEFLGSNIISSRDDEWRRYRSVIKPALQDDFDPVPLFKHADKLTDILCPLGIPSNGKTVLVQEILQRYSSANLLHCVFGCKDLSSRMMSIDHEVSLHSTQLRLKRYLFRPLFMNFPALDRLASIIPSRATARNLIRAFCTSLEVEMAKEHAVSSKTEPKPHSLCHRLIGAWHDGIFSTKEFHDNLKVLYVAGQENPQLLMLSSLYLLGKYPTVQEKLRQEIQAACTGNASLPEWQRLPYLTATILESLRLLPPISQLINRKVSQPTTLAGNLYLPKDTYIGYNCYSTNRDPAVWGPDADQFRPERWGSSHEQISRRYRAAKARAEFVSFHGGSRACLGEKFALLEMRVTLFVLVRNLQWVLDREWRDQMTPAGPLHPRGLRLVFARI